jgi:hypothetical protein
MMDRRAMGVPFAEPLSLSTPLGAAAIYFHPHNSNKETHSTHSLESFDGRETQLLL